MCMLAKMNSSNVDQTTGSQHEEILCGHFGVVLQRRGVLLMTAISLEILLTESLYAILVFVAFEHCMCHFH